MSTCIRWNNDSKIMNKPFVISFRYFRIKNEKKSLVADLNKQFYDTRRETFYSHANSRNNIFLKIKTTDMLYKMSSRKGFS